MDGGKRRNGIEHSNERGHENGNEDHMNALVTVNFKPSLHRIGVVLSITSEEGFEGEELFTVGHF